MWPKPAVLAAAAGAFAESLEILERLAVLDPTNTGWQRDLAIAQISAGGVAEASDDLVRAERAFAHALEISERLAALGPTDMT